MISNTAYFITGKDLSYLVDVLNSKFIEFCFKSYYSISLGKTGIRWLSQYISKLPIIEIARLNNFPKSEIDEYLYEKYKLNLDEINYIQSV